MALIYGKDGINHKVTKLYKGVGGVNKEQSKLYKGVDGVNKLVYQNCIYNKKITTEFFDEFVDIKNYKEIEIKFYQYRVCKNETSVSCFKFLLTDHFSIGIMDQRKPPYETYIELLYENRTRYRVTEWKDPIFHRGLGEHNIVIKLEQFKFKVYADGIYLNDMDTPVTSITRLFFSNINFTHMRNVEVTIK